MTPSSTSASACALALAGQHAQGVAPVEEAHQRARRLGHPRLEADARLQLGLLQSPWPAAS